MKLWMNRGSASNGNRRWRRGMRGRAADGPLALAFPLKMLLLLLRATFFPSNNDYSLPCFHPRLYKCIVFKNVSPFPRHCRFEHSSKLTFVLIFVDWKIFSNMEVKSESWDCHRPLWQCHKTSTSKKGQKGQQKTRVGNIERTKSVESAADSLTRERANGQK